MSIMNDPAHPMYVPEENRRVARERASKYIEIISDYLEVKDKIPTGFNRQDQIKENKKRILTVLGGTEKDWQDWKWQTANAIRDIRTLARIISLTEKEIAEIEKTATQYRWAVSPHYAGLMDPEDRACPIRLQAVPTILELIGLAADVELAFDGQSLMPVVRGEVISHRSEFYITECTWMRKHGWRTPEWKLIHALEPDFHFKPEVDLYNLITDPGETRNLAAEEPELAAALEARMQAWIKRREKETGRPNPISTNLNWHGKGCGPFKTSQQAYDTMHIGSPNAARNLQELRTQRGARKL